MRHYLLGLTCVVAVVASASPARADDDEKATADYKVLAQWLTDQAKTPKKPDEKKAFLLEWETRLRAFLKDHPAAGSETRWVKGWLGEDLYNLNKLDESISIFEELLKATEEDQHALARKGIIECLIMKKDLKGARTRLDGFLKEHGDEEALPKLDEHLKHLETAANVKVGAEAPPVKTKGADGKDVELASFKGKIVVLHFWTTAKCKQDLPAVKAAYADLHAKGVEVIGIDFLEKDWDAYKKLVEKEQLSWPLITGKEALAVSRDFGIKHVPCVMLVGKDGKLLSLEVRIDLIADSVKAAADGKPLPTAPHAPPKGSDGE